MERKPVSLALQGGGSHGAFTWGVLDRLLEDPRIDIRGISGASAGSMNAVALAHGFVVGGREGARQALKDFWESVASKTPFASVGDSPTLIPEGADMDPSASIKAMVSLSRFFAPFQLNPLDINPLREILMRQIDFDRLRAEGRIKLFMAATEVRTGRLKLFRNKELTLDALLASACLPTVHRPIEIEGEAYWDGGLAANPPLFPLLHQCNAHDLIVVLLHPSKRPDLPSTADEIWQRLTEISFTSAFFTELTGLALAKQEAERPRFAFGALERKLRALNLHLIENDELMTQLSVHSKLNVAPAFLGSTRQILASATDVAGVTLTRQIRSRERSEPAATSARSYSASTLLTSLRRFAPLRLVRSALMR
jgi:NTE family protein